ncbi:MAG: cytochrome c maturation protein CcmE [Candidatus Binatia bacterium]
MHLNLRFVAGGLAIVAAIGWLMFLGIRETSAYYLTIDEFLPRKDTLGASPLRVAGRVRAGSIDYDAKTLALRFAIGAFDEKGNVGAAVPVAYTGIKPDLFAEGRDVIIEGRYREGTIHADKVLTSCPSKYEAKLEPPAAGGPTADVGPS